uniref:Uncharacterized protein n=1 Tax=Steinernema glaseri TaxID=37863 RepID=A0A1I8AWH3_9BILA
MTYEDPSQMPFQSEPLRDAASQPSSTCLPVSSYEPFPVFNDDPIADATLEQQIPGAFEYFPVF